jgi:molybdopterin/thiamine biosynthesis adenylyltransferase
MRRDERLRHERAYRGDPLLDKLADCPVTVCGAGALGSWLAENLARQGFQKIRAIDNDRVEAHNLETKSTQATLGRSVSRCEPPVEAGGDEAVSKRLEEGNCPALLKGSGLVVDTLDNSQGRRLVTRCCAERSWPCLHVGMNGGFGEIRWNQGYRIPEDPEEGDVCDAPLARNLVLLLTAVSGESIIRYLAEGKMENYSVTLEDLQINPGE